MASPKDQGWGEDRVRTIPEMITITKGGEGTVVVAAPAMIGATKTATITIMITVMIMTMTTTITTSRVVTVVER